MSRKFTSILYLLLSLQGVIVFAQDHNSELSINDVKRQPDKYVYAEFTSESSEEAMSNAVTILTDVILNEIDPSVEDRRLVAESIVRLATPILTKRGRLNRTFLYVSKQHLPKENEGNRVILEESTFKTLYDSEEPTILIADKEKLPASIVENEQESVVDIKTSAKDPLVTKIMEISKASEIQPLVKNLKSAGKISSYGRMKDLPSSGICYIFIFASDNSIRAWLRKENHNIINLVSGTPQQLTEYKGCGGIWIK